MRYLDAKKRLIFMMAVCKYIKLIFKKDVTITEDNIRLLVDTAVPLIFPEYIITSEDKTQIIEGIKSYILKLKNIQITVNNSVTFETVKRDTLQICEVVNADELAELITAVNNAVQAAETMISLASYNRLITSGIQNIKNNDVSTALDDKISAFIRQSIPVIFESEKLTLTDKNTLLNNIKALLLSEKENIQINSEGLLEVIRKDLIKVNSALVVNTDIVALLTIMKELLYSNEISTVLDREFLTTAKITALQTRSINTLMEYAKIITINAIKDKLYISSDLSTDNSLLLTTTVSGITLLFKDDLIKTKSEALLDLITSEISYIDISEKLLVNDLVTFNTGLSEVIGIDKKVVSAALNQLSSTIGKKLALSATTNTVDATIFVKLYPDLVKANETIFTANHIDLNADLSNLIKASDINKISNDVVLTLSDFISLPFEINAKLNMVEKSFLYVIQTILVSFVGNNITKDLTVFKEALASHIKNISNLTIDTSLQILRYRYSKLLDWDQIDMDSVLNTNIINLIFVEN